MTVAVSAERVIKELHELWRSLAEAQPEGHPPAVVRACSMTLIVAANDAEDCESAGEVLASIMREHPSRAIVLRVNGNGEHLLEHRVAAQCWKPFGNEVLKPMAWMFRNTPFHRFARTCRYSAVVLL